MGNRIWGATPPRRNGKPDLSGVWEAARAEQTESERAASKVQIDLADISTPLRSVFWGPKREEEPLTPAALALMAQRRPQLMTTKPVDAILDWCYGSRFIRRSRLAKRGSGRSGSKLGSTFSVLPTPIVRSAYAFSSHSNAFSFPPSPT